ncbi:MAG: cell division protein FtsL [Bacteroidota bacterium]|nr:cell division protein FtsL [Bacteroidota bacterium]
MPDASDSTIPWSRAVPHGKADRQGTDRGTFTAAEIVFLLAVTALLVVGYISNTVMVDASMRTVTRLDREIQVLVQQREALRAEINYLASYTRVERIARQHLGMIHAPRQPISLRVHDLPLTAEGGEPDR